MRKTNRRSLICIREGDKRYKFPVAKYMIHGHDMYCVGNIANNDVISLYGDRS